MGKQFPVSGIFLAAFLVVAASALSRPSAHKDAGQCPSGPSTPAMQGSSQQSLSARRVFTKTTAEVSSSLVWESEASRRRAAGSRGVLDILLLDPPSLQPAPLETAGPAPSALTRPPLAPSAAGPGKETLTPGSLQIAAVMSSQPSPACGSGKKCSKAPGASVTAFAPASATLKMSVTPRPTQQSAPAALAPTTPASTFGHPSARHTFGPRTQRPSAPGAGLVGSGASPPLTLVPRSPGRRESSVSPGQPELASMAKTLAATEPLSPAGRGLDMASPGPTVGSGPPRPAVTSGLGPRPSGAMLLLPSTVPSSWPSSLSSSPPPPSPSPSLLLALVSSVTVTTRARSPPASSTASFTPFIPDPGLSTSGQNSASREPNHVTRSMTLTFRITSKAFSPALWSPENQEQLLSEHICHQLQPVFHDAFPSFQGIGVLVFTPGSAAMNVNTSLMFGASMPAACDVLWTLYRKVKAWRGLVGNLLLAENSLTVGGSNLTDLALETVSINFIAMRPFLSQFLLPGSAPFDLLEDQILHLLTPAVSGFYEAHPLQGPLLLFSNADQWVNVYVEYKFQNPIPSQLRGLASHLAHSIMDPVLQKSSLVANGEKAELALYEMRLQILGRPFTLALADKTSLESQELRQQLTRWLTAVLGTLQNFGQVVVEEFQPEPLTAKVGATFFGATPAQVLIQDRVRQALYILREAEDVWAEVVSPVPGAHSSRASAQPGSGTPSPALLVCSLLLVTLGLVLGVQPGGLMPCRTGSRSGQGTGESLEAPGPYSGDSSPHTAGLTHTFPRGCCHSAWQAR